MKEINTDRQSLAARWRTLMRGHVVLQVFVTILTTGYSHFALATNYYVNQANAQCSNSGPGTQPTPFCTVSAGAAVAGAGDTVEVASGSYSEQVTISNSGLSDQQRVVFKAADNATVTVQGQAFGFRLLSVSYVTVQGFTTQNNSANGIYMSQCFNCKILDNHVTRAGQPVSGKTQKGIYVGNSADSLIEGNLVNFNSDSGIYLINGSTGITIKNNILHDNARGYITAAPGIDVRTNSNTIIGNISFDNEDSGIQLYQGASNNIVVNNACYDNGDHGIDISSSPGNTAVGNTIVSNLTTGINVEGSASSPAINTTVANNVTFDNALNSPATKGNIRVDSRSDPGTTIDYDLMYLSQPGIMIVWDGISYSSLAAMQAQVPTQEIHGIEALPQFLNPGADDFHLTSLSPAIDSANSGANGAQDTDVGGNPRVDVDDTFVPNTGAGPRTYDDRGAYERQFGDPGDLTPPTVPANLVAATASSTEIDLTWSPSTDNVGVTGYNVYRDDNLIDTTATAATPAAPFHDTGLTPSTFYTYEVEAFDLAGNTSARSSPASATTQDPSGITLTFNPDDDAAIKADSAGSNFGTKSKLEVDSSPVEHSLIKFTVRGVGARTVTSAVLRFYCANASDNGGSIYPVADDSWLESTVIWNNAPAADETPPPIASLGAATLNTWVEANVTSYITGDGTYSMRIISPSTDGADYRSRQYAGFKPELVILAE